MIRYLTSDNKTFDSIEEAISYEEELECKNVKYYAFNRNGKIAINPDEACVLYIPSAHRPDYIEPAAKVFIRDCQKQDCPSNGIYEDSYGWHYWDEYEEVYRPVDIEAIQIMLKAIKILNEKGVKIDEDCTL